jgi:hypothetical protein
MVDVVERPEIHEAEAARVVEGDGRPALHLEDDVVVLVAGAGFVVELARLLSCFWAFDREAAGHAEVHDQGFAV